jgi:hypothetical protein
MTPFFALITPVAPPQPGQPPGIWGGSNEPFPGYWVPGAPGAPGYQPPTGQPPGMWGGSNEPFPGWGLPPEGWNPPEPPAGAVPEGKALVILYVPGEGFKTAVVPKPGPPGNMPPAVQPVKRR